MKFLCDQHRTSLEQNIAQAKQSWQKATGLARQQVSIQDWNKALFYFGNALEIAEIILTKAPCKENTEAYMRTAIEFAHTLRNTNHQANHIALYNSVFHCLDTLQCISNIHSTMQPLKDVLFEPIDTVNGWMEQWRALLSNPSCNVH